MRNRHMIIQQPYNITGTRCVRCNSEGPFLLDPDDKFAFREDRTIYFTPGYCGLDISCECSACGFAGELGDFYEWVDVVGEEHDECVKDFRERFKTRPASSRNSRRGVFEDALATNKRLLPESSLIDLLVESMHWAERHEHSFEYLLDKAASLYQSETTQSPTEEA